MPQTINTNLMSMNAQRHLNKTQIKMETSVQRLASGLRVNSARDDAVGLAMAERMNAQVRGMNVAVRNANDGISLAQVAEGGLAEIGEMLQRMRELAVQSANGTNGTSDRANLHAEFSQLDQEITRLTEVIKFNGQAILGSGAATFTFQVGANAGESMSLTTTPITATGLTVSTASGAGLAITGIDAAIDIITTSRATYGAAQSRFTSAINSLAIAVENQEAARSRIVDADFAVETTNMTKAQILKQAGMAMVAQANAQPQQVLSLLQG
jgi:flagellin